MIDLLKTIAICFVLYAGFSHAAARHHENEVKFKKWYFGRPKNDSVENLSLSDNVRTRTVQTYSAGDVVFIFCRTAPAMLDFGTDPDATSKGLNISIGMGTLIEIHDNNSYIEIYPAVEDSFPNCYFSEKIID